MTSGIEPGRESPSIDFKHLQRHEPAAGKDMNRIESPYYPPRARWYSRWLYAGRALRRQLWLDRIHLPGPVPTGRFIGGLLVPGYAFYAGGKRLIGRAILGGSVVLAAVFFLWLGHPIANAAFGLLLSAHATSVLFLLSPWLAGERFEVRIVAALLVVALLGGGLYTPARNLIQKHCLLPLRLKEQVVVIKVYSSAKDVRRGDWIAYELPPGGGAGIHVPGGPSLGPVLAVAGDRVRFTPDGFEVNGAWRRLRSHMPTAGEMIVADKTWLVWPDVQIIGHGNINVPAALLPLAIVSETQFIGKPFQRWFWRRQHWS